MRASFPQNSSDPFLQVTATEHTGTLGLSLPELLTLTPTHLNSDEHKQELEDPQTLKTK